ncbi:Sodium, potassium, lithium and rubidium/H(+) antiporter [compost metagenome]
MRGVVSLAAALAIPLTLKSGEAFPHRNLILFITFTVILLTLLIQGLTLPYIIERSHIFDQAAEMEDEEAKHRVKKQLISETVRLLKARQEGMAEEDVHLQRMIAQWEHKINNPEQVKMSESTKLAYLELLEGQRLFLSDLNRNDAEVHDEVIRLHIYQIDLEEERVRLL